MNIKSLALRATGWLTFGVLVAMASGCGDSPTEPTPDPDSSAAPGIWTGAGTNPDGSQFEVCFNVASDGVRLTAQGSTCDSDGDGTGDAAFVVGITSARDNRGGSCEISILRQEDEEITLGPLFVWEVVSPTGALEKVFGEFGEGNTATGTAEWNLAGRICMADWSASLSR